MPKRERRRIQLVAQLRGGDLGHVGDGAEHELAPALATGDGLRRTRQRSRDAAACEQINPCRCSHGHDVWCELGPDADWRVGPLRERSIYTPCVLASSPCTTTLPATAQADQLPRLERRR